MKTLWSCFLSLDLHTANDSLAFRSFFESSMEVIVAACSR